MHKTKKVLSLIFITHNQTAKVLQPREQPLDFPSSPVAPQWSAVLCDGFLPVPLVRRDHFNTCLSQGLIKRVRVIRLVTNQSSGLLTDKALSESAFDKGDFMRRSRACVDGERKTRAVCHCHELRTLAPLGLSHVEAPFLAVTNVPSIK